MNKGKEKMVLSPERKEPGVEKTSNSEHDSNGPPDPPSKKENQSDGPPDPPNKKGNQSEKPEKRKNKLPFDLDYYRQQLAVVKQNVLKLKKTTLFAAIIGEPLELKEIRLKIRKDWKFLKGNFQIIPKTDKWFEMKFVLPEDKDRVWAGHPFHVIGQLLLLKQWRQGFDPPSESLSILDMWIRIPGLPSEFISKDILTSIIEANKLGSVLKLDVFTMKGNRVKYPRICVNVDVKTIPRKKRVLVLDENDKLVSYPVWFEEFPEGCGYCGGEDHLFADCPLRKLEGASAGGPSSAAEAFDAAAGDASDHGGEDDWKRVASSSKPPTTALKVGKSKEEILKYFGIDAGVSLGSSSAASLGPIEGGLTPTVQPIEHVATMPYGAAVIEVDDLPESSPSVLVMHDAAENTFGAEFDFVSNPNSAIIAAEEDYADAIAINPEDVVYSDVDELGPMIAALDPKYEDDLYASNMEEMLVDYDSLFGELQSEDLDDIVRSGPPDDAMMSDLSNPAVLAASLALPDGGVAISSSMMNKMESLGVQSPSRSESSKRKVDHEDSDSVSSKM